MKHAVKHIHFIGIGGVGMSGIAEVLLNLGYAVSGSDLADNAVTQDRLGEMATLVDASALLIARAAWEQDMGAADRKSAAMAKLHATEAAQTVIDMALQMHGGMGVTVEWFAAAFEALPLAGGRAVSGWPKSWPASLRSSLPAGRDSAPASTGTAPPCASCAV